MTRNIAVLAFLFLYVCPCAAIYMIITNFFALSQPVLVDEFSYQRRLALKHEHSQIYRAVALVITLIVLSLIGYYYKKYKNEKGFNLTL